MVNLLRKGMDCGTFHKRFKDESSRVPRRGYQLGRWWRIFWFEFDVIQSSLVFFEGHWLQFGFVGEERVSDDECTFECMVNCCDSASIGSR